ncbi:MAG: restriction endonuclease subunit S [Bacteroidales bacterium]|nr:restriction endonuclease subunit S [Bacteroidales bacterium]
MALSKYKLGELIRLEDERNSQGLYSLEDVKGISIQKIFIETKADMQGVSLTPYILVKPDFFAYVTVTSRNGEKITLAHNTTENTYIVSSSYVVFSIKRADLLLSDYLFMYFNRPEFDRYSRFNSWGSARETFSWEDFCDIEIVLPSLDIQQKYVDVYNAMLANQQTYERGLEDLKLVCDGYIEDLRRKMPCEKIGGYIEERNFKNSGNKIKEVRSVSVTKEFKLTNAKVNKNELSNYLVVQPKEIAFVQTTGNEKVLAFAYNNYDYPVVVSSVDKVFCSKDETILDLQYLSLFLSRKEFDRYARFNSWGSARETFTFEDMKEVEIPIPDIEIQKSIVNIYNCYIERKRINEQLKAQIKDICPILIKGSIEEGRKNRE